MSEYVNSAAAEGMPKLKSPATWLAPPELNANNAVSITYINLHGESRTKLVSNEASNRWLLKRRRQQIADIKAGKVPRFRPCSGQSRSDWEWSVCDVLDPDWRPRTRRGRKRLFPSQESAQRYADKLNKAEIDHD